MKHTRQQIIDMSNRSHSHADALATLYQMIREEIEQERKITRRKIRASVDMTTHEHKLYGPMNDVYAIAESVFAAAGWTIVDDEPKTSEAECADNCSRMAAFAEGVDKLRNLVKDVEDLANQARSMRDGTEWRPIEEVPDNECKLYIVGSKRYANGMEYAYMSGDKWLHAFTGILMQYQPTHYLPIPPLPENDK